MTVCGPGRLLHLRVWWHRDSKPTPVPPGEKNGAVCKLTPFFRVPASQMQDQTEIDKTVLGFSRTETTFYNC